MKKILILLLCATLSASFCACTEIGVEDSKEAEGSTHDSGIVDDSAASSADADISEDNSDSSDAVIDDSSTTDVIIDNSSTVETKYTTTDDYTYAITLSEEEINCINAGSDGKYMILVNKTNKLPDNYVPEDLVDIRDTRKDRAPEKMVRTAEIALHAFLKEAAYCGYNDITVTSGYRSIAKQQSLFNMYVNQEMAKGKDRESAIAAASVYSAYPGTSEHHTGLCVDMHNLPAASQSFGATEEAMWLAKNAHRFGFILRFPQDKENITTYMWEPWHFRFVGVHYATDIYESGLCFEEYVVQNDAAEEIHG